jgi:hypothetical protein
MVDIYEISAMVAAAGIVVGVVYYILDIRYNMKARETEISRMFTSEYVSDQGLQRYATVMTLEWKDHEDFMKKYGYSNPEMFGKWVSQFFAHEAMGGLLRNKVIRAQTLYTLGGYGAIWLWDKYKDIIQSRRDVAWGRDYMSDFEFFAQEMLKIKLRNDPSFKDKLETYRRTLKP